MKYDGSLGSVDPKIIDKMKARLAETKEERLEALKENPQHFFINYMKNYSSITTMAFDYGIDVTTVLELIKKGREIQNGK